jgi:hypothetical protein
MLTFFVPPPSAVSNEITLKRGGNFTWPWQATIVGATNQPVPLPLTQAGLEILFVIKGTIGDDDGNAFIIKDNYAWMGLTITDAPNGMVAVSFLPADTDRPIFPAYPCLLTWSMKLITPGGVNLSLGSGPVVIEDDGIQKYLYP